MNARKPESKSRIKTVTLKNGSTLTYQRATYETITVLHRWPTGFQLLVLDKDRWAKMH